MVQPVRLLTRGGLGAGIVLSIVCATSVAAAEPLPASCRVGLVLGVPEPDANDVVASVCSAASRRGTSGAIRVSVVSADGRIRIVVARQSDTMTAEQTAHVESASIAEAIRMAPPLLDAWDPRSAPAPIERTPDPVQEAPVPKEEPRKPLETRAGPPAAFLGVHGSAGNAAGGTGVGGGASIGVDHRSVQGFIDYSNSSTSTSPGRFEHQLVTIGARLKLSRRAVKPVIGGGWSYIHYERGEGLGFTRGEGVGVFGETGVIWEIGNHQLMALGRANMGIYDEATSRASSHGSLTPTLAFLAGYGYAFR